MANFQLIKDIAKAKGITLEELADKVGIQAQAIHLMVRSGSTKIDTLERIAKELDVPAYIFLDYNFDLKEYQREIILGGQNAFSYYGGSHIHNDGSDHKTTDSHDLIKAKEEMIALLKEQLREARQDKAHMREEIDFLREENRRLRTNLTTEN